MSTYEELKVAGICTRCRKTPALEDSTLCEPCRAANRARSARWFANRWAKRKRERLCVDCGVKLKSRGIVRCVACRVKRGIVKRDAKAILDHDLDQARDRIAARTELVTEGDGRTRERYRGKHTGKPSVAERDSDDLAAAFTGLRRCQEGLAVARAPQTLELPRIQREAVVNEALAHADMARRFLEEMLARHRYGTGRNRGDSRDLAED